MQNYIMFDSAFNVPDTPLTWTTTGLLFNKMIEAIAALTFSSIEFEQRMTNWFFSGINFINFIFALLAPYSPNNLQMEI